MKGSFGPKGVMTHRVRTTALVQLRKPTSLHLVLHGPHHPIFCSFGICELSGFVSFNHCLLWTWGLHVLRWVLWCPHEEMNAFWMSLLCLQSSPALEINILLFLLWPHVFLCFKVRWDGTASLTSSHWEINAKGTLHHTCSLCYNSNNVSGTIARNEIYEHCLKWTPQSYLCTCLFHHLSLSRSQLTSWSYLCVCLLHCLSFRGSQLCVTRDN